MTYASSTCTSWLSRGMWRPNRRHSALATPKHRLSDSQIHIDSAISGLVGRLRPEKEKKIIHRGSRALASIRAFASIHMVFQELLSQLGCHGSDPVWHCNRLRSPELDSIKRAVTTTWGSHPQAVVDSELRGGGLNFRDLQEEKDRLTSQTGTVFRMPSDICGVRGV